MKKKLLSLALALVLALSTALPAFAADFVWSDGVSHYADVPMDHWCYEEIMTLSVKGIVSGSGGKYRPDDTVTKAAALKMVINSLGVELQSDPSGSGKWYADYLYTARQLGAVDEAFAASVEGAITRLGMAQLMASLSGMDASGGAASPFADCTDSAVTMLYEKGIALGKVGADGKRYFNGERTLSRGEMAVFCLRLLRTAQTQKARELAKYYNLPTNISFTENPKTRQEFVNDLLIEYMNGNYRPTFFFNTPEDTMTAVQSMNAGKDKIENGNEIFNIRYVARSYPEIYGFFNNIGLGFEYSTDEKMAGVRFAYEPELDDAALYAQQMEALEFAKELSQELRSQGKIQSGMTQKQIAQVYFDWLQNLNIKSTPKETHYLGGHCVHYDSAYAALVNKVADCVGRAAAYSLLLGVEGIPCRGLAGHMEGATSGHVLNYMVLDGTAYIADPPNRISITPVSAISTSRFVVNPLSLEYVQECCARG